MELRNFLDAGIQKAGTLTALSREIGITQPELSNAKAGRRSLPNHAIIALADYTKSDLRAVMAANELVTEKDERRRAYWLEILAAAATKAACVTLLVAGTGTDALADQTLTASADRDNLYYVNHAMLIGLRQRNKRGNDRTGHRHRRTQIDRRRCTPARRIKRTRSSAFFLRLRFGTIARTNDAIRQR